MTTTEQKAAQKAAEKTCGGRRGARHTYDSGLCTTCWAEAPEEKASRLWNKRIRAIAAGRDDWREVEPIKGYHTAPQDAVDLFTASGNTFAAECAKLARQDGRAYRAFRRAAEAR